ncbi:MAG: FecR domain-containing protein [Pseudomonadota bacterium]
MSSFDSFEKLGETADAHLGDGASDLRLAEGRRRFTDAVSLLPAPRSRTRPFVVVVLATLTTLTMTGAMLLLVPWARRSAHTVAGGGSGPSAAHEAAGRPQEGSGSADGDHATSTTAALGEVVRLETSREQSGATVQLASGAAVTLSSRTRGESRRVGPRQYRVTLDRGQMTFNIDPHAGTTWMVEVGGYKVRVVGTIFTVVHDAEREAIEVHVVRGRVEVSGGRVGGQHLGGDAHGVFTVDAGATLRALGGDVKIKRAGEPGGHSPAAPAASGGPAPGAPGSPRRTGDQGAASAISTDWSARYDSGDYVGAWRSAQGKPYDRLVSGLDVTRLSHLADAARLSGDEQGARTVLVALRRRFPGAREANDAAFLLGRLASDGIDSNGEAARWFQTYLAEKPDGFYAQEAQGRLIVVHQRAGRLDAARDAARRYLAQHRGGPYGAVADALLK